MKNTSLTPSEPGGFTFNSLASARIREFSEKKNA